MNHSAFNTANALGPFLGGLAIREGFGWTSTGPVGAALALLSFLIWIVAWRDARTTADVADNAPLAPARPSPRLAPDHQNRTKDGVA